MSCFSTIHDLLATPEQLPDGPQVVIFAQARPGQFSAGDMERVSRQLPLAHQVTLLGSLCEGETRSGHPWPGMTRVFWYQFLPRYRDLLESGQTPQSWKLPRTASDVERRSADLEPPSQTADHLVAIFTSSAVSFDGLADACQAGGYTAAWCRDEQTCGFRGAIAGIWDAAASGDLDYDQLRRIVARVPGLPLIILWSFPRIDQVQTAHQHGAAAVLSTPYLLTDLWHTIRDVSSRFSAGQSDSGARSPQ